jgi:hypothetical protein
MIQSSRWPTAIVVALLAAVALAAGPATLTPAAVKADLDGLLAATDGIERRQADIAAIVKGLPASWRVDVGGHTLELRCDWIRRDLLALAHTPDPKAAAAAIRSRIRRSRADLDACEAAPADRSAERARAAAILAAPEFAGVHGPTPFDRLKQRVLDYLVDLLGRLLGSSDVPAVGRIVIYGLLALAILATLGWVYRTLRRPAAGETILPADAPVSSKNWLVWLAEARAAATRLAWPDAVRLAYWAGVSSLESRHLWPPDRARTPREYLRLLPPEHEYGGPLRFLTSTFERVWYGRETADDMTFAAAVDALERLGCGSR